MKKIIIFGAGNKLFDHKEIFSNYEIYAIVDNKICDVPEWIDELDSYVYNPKEIKNMPPYPVIICTSYISSAYKQLLQYGVDEKRIDITTCLENSTYWHEQKLADLLNYIKKDKNGVWVEFKNMMYLLDGTETIVGLAECMKRYESRGEDKHIDSIINMSVKPIDRIFGFSRGTAVDRYYIENFLHKYRSYITGNCLEIAEDTYIKKFGKVPFSTNILHVNGWGKNVIKGNFETGEGLKEEEFNCMVITQTLMFIKNLNDAVENMYRSLKKGGCALITVSGITQISRYDADNWGDYWRFNYDGIKSVMESVFGHENIEIVHYGNVKTACALLYGVAVEELKKVDLDYKDYDYPVIYGIVARKL